jgi:hypothetical protein
MIGSHAICARAESPKQANPGISSVAGLGLIHLRPRVIGMASAR